MMGQGAGAGDKFVDYLFDLNKQLLLPSKLGAIGVTEGHIETLADLAEADFCHPNNPKPVSREDFKKIYQEAL
jgi:alcohol dehydrogenase class IV